MLAHTHTLKYNYICTDYAHKTNESNVTYTRNWRATLIKSNKYDNVLN